MATRQCHSICLCGCGQDRGSTGASAGFHHVGADALVRPSGAKRRSLAKTAGKRALTPDEGVRGYVFVSGLGLDMATRQTLLFEILLVVILCLEESFGRNDLGDHGLAEAP